MRVVKGPEGAGPVLGARPGGRQVVLCPLCRELGPRAPDLCRGSPGYRSRGTGNSTDGDLAQGAVSPLATPPDCVRVDRGESGGAATVDQFVLHLDSK